MTNCAAQYRTFHNPETGEEFTVTETTLVRDLPTWVREGIEAGMRILARPSVVCKEYWRLYMAMIEAEPKEQKRLLAALGKHVRECGCRLTTPPPGKVDLSFLHADGQNVAFDGLLPGAGEG